MALLIALVSALIPAFLLAVLFFFIGIKVEIAHHLKHPTEPDSMAGLSIFMVAILAGIAIYPIAAYAAFGALQPWRRPSREVLSVGSKFRFISTNVIILASLMAFYKLGYTFGPVAIVGLLWLSVANIILVRSHMGVTDRT
ncbi:hypothetical protein H7849_18170 [Alloacidobacterium dinghuense]|uniref:Uncharacterized protein n=1 Tax=Alloacidobacterium dinghuense TaxID=2763107 RepID=A0A7G8BEP9_9BACT|nr:hypothetical protein [Alloacidobacterium dinghuense]QNI31019.1 hypothetical protein H7849_18170 [Alloacidobacterium dinghuense]